MINKKTAYNILGFLDSWRLKDGKNPDLEEIKNKTKLSQSDIKKLYGSPNRKVSLAEVDFHYNDALSDAETYVGARLSYFKDSDKDDFLKAVYKLAASKLWNVYNPRVESDETEGTYLRSYGGILYTDAYKKLDNLIVSRSSTLYGLSG